MRIVLSDHSIQRGYDRLCKTSDGLLEMATEAYVMGFRKSDYKGKFGKYLGSKTKKYGNITIRIWSGYIWIYVEYLNNEKRLITFYSVPKKFAYLDIYKKIEYDK